MKPTTLQDRIQIRSGDKPLTRKEMQEAMRKTSEAIKDLTRRLP